MTTSDVGTSIVTSSCPTCRRGYHRGGWVQGDEEILEIDGREVRITSPGQGVLPGARRDEARPRPFLPPGRRAADAHDGWAAARSAALPSRRGRAVLLPEAHPRLGAEWLETTIVSTPNGTTSRALVAADLAHVAWAVNLNCLGFHVWPYLAADPEHTDELRLDLDPQPGTDFTHVREAAAELRSLLDELGIVGYPKTTGNRGLHVYVRLEPRWDSYQVRFAAVAVARELERRRPDLITAQWWKEERGERIFVDFNQNAPHKTVFGAWCVRARTGRAGLDAPAVGRDRRDPPGRADDRVAACPPRGERRPVGGDERRPAVPRAAARDARARPRERADGRAVAARLPEAAGRAAARLAEPREEVLTPHESAGSRVSPSPDAVRRARKCRWSSVSTRSVL